VIFVFCDKQYAALKARERTITQPLYGLRLSRGIGVKLNLPQFNGHFKKYTESYTIEEKGVSDEKTEAVV
jgi:hypothetical protein